MKNDVIDVEVKDVKIEQFLSEKKELVLNAAQRTVEAYLEVGKHLKEVNEKLATRNGVNSRWGRWLEEVGFDAVGANNAILVFNKYGHKNVFIPSQVISILQQLSKPSNDPEKVALIEQKLAKGEKMTVAAVKEALKKMPETEREIVSQASYEIAEENRTGMTRDELDSFYETQAIEYQEIEDEIEVLKPVVKKQYADMMIESHREAFLDDIELYSWILELKTFAENNGYKCKTLTRENNTVFNENKKIEEHIKHAKSQIKEVFN
jgi:hypothetical protein